MSFFQRLRRRGGPGPKTLDIPPTNQEPYTPEYHAWRDSEPDWLKARDTLLNAGEKPPPIQDGREGYEYNAWSSAAPKMDFDLAGFLFNYPPTKIERESLEAAFTKGGPLGHLSKWGRRNSPEAVVGWADLELRPTDENPPRPVGVFMEGQLLGYVPHELADPWADTVGRWGAAGYRVRVHVRIWLGYDYGAETNPHEGGRVSPRPSISSVTVYARPDANYPLPGQAVVPAVEDALRHDGGARPSMGKDLDVITVDSGLATVRRYFEERLWPTTSSDRGVLVAFPKAMVLAMVLAIGDKPLLVLKTLLVGEIPETESLHEYVATNQPIYQLTIVRDDAGLSAWLNHTWPVEDVTRHALLQEVEQFVFVAEETARHLLSAFGGRTPHR